MYSLVKNEYKVDLAFRRENYTQSDLEGRNKSSLTIHPISLDAAVMFVSLFIQGKKEKALTQIYNCTCNSRGDTFPVRSLYRGDI